MHQWLSTRVEQDIIHGITEASKSLQYANSDETMILLMSVMYFKHLRDLKSSSADELRYRVYRSLYNRGYHEHALQLYPGDTHQSIERMHNPVPAPERIGFFRRYLSSVRF